MVKSYNPALRYMKLRYAIACCLILGTGAFVARAQVSSPSSPFVLAVTNISSASVLLWTNNAVSFHFVDAGMVDVDELDQELAKSGIQSQRRVRIIEGMQVVAEGRLLGRAWGIRGNGFLLRFDSAGAAEKAAEIMRDKAAFVVPKKPRCPEIVYQGSACGLSGLSGWRAGRGTP